MQDKVDHDTMIKVSVLPRHIGAALTMVVCLGALRANGAGARTRQGVSLKLRQFASPNERCSVESAPHQIVKECGSYHDNIRVGNPDPLSWTK
jgi:hypothetical protein